MKIALLGDYDATVLAHQAIPKAIETAARALAASAEIRWIPSSEVDPQALTEFDALWCVPLSPYRDPERVIDAIRFARETDLPFLGTCAGYQHAVLEFARNVLGLDAAESGEDNPETSMPLITALACRLADEADAVNLLPGSRLADIYRTDRIIEEYNCGFGVNPDYLPLFANSDMKFCATDDSGQPRACELGGKRFFFGTAYQPERSALQHATHPLLITFLMAAL